MAPILGIVRSLAAVAVLGVCSLALAQRSTPVTVLDPAGSGGDHFGSSVAVSGDTMVVGAPNDAIGGNVDQGSAHVYRWTGSGWTFEATLTASDGAAGDEFGWSVALSGDTAIVGAYKHDVGGNGDRGAAYVFTRSGTTWTQQAILTAADGLGGDWLGYSVSVAGDTAIVSAVFDDLGPNTDQGSAYVFTRSGTVWTQQAKVTAADGVANDQFGQSVALSADTAIVSSRWYDGGRGAAYVFVRSGATWTLQAQLTASDREWYDWFGVAVAISGDTALVGAYDSLVGGNSYQGSAYIFVRSGTTWTEQAHLIASDGAVNDEFGLFVALSEDTALVGSHSDDVGDNADQGSAYVFVRSGTTWTQQAKLTAPDGAAGDTFGAGVAVFGDTAIVGAFGDDVGANADQGSAWVFSRVGSLWIGPGFSVSSKVVAADGAAGDGFGVSVAVDGDTAIVGAYGDDAPNTDQGSAYIFVRSGATWTQQAKLVASDGAGQDNFGISVALSGDTALVGARYDSASYDYQGSAYVFVRSGTTWTQQAKLVAADAAFNDQFGHSVSLSGDTGIVGAEGGDVWYPNQGAAYIFVRSGTTWTQQAKLVASDGAPQDFFGWSVALSGNTALIGAVFDDGSNLDQGSAYVFVRSGAIWTQQAKLVAADGAQYDEFGSDVSLSGDTAIMGSAGSDVSYSNQGAAYVFVRSGTTWTQQAKLVAADAAPSDNFGFSIALSGDTALVGARFDTVSHSAQGSAYIFVRSGTMWTQQAQLVAPDGAAGDLLGFSVALSGETALVGAYRDSVTYGDQGSAYIFDVPSDCYSYCVNNTTGVLYPDLAVAMLVAQSGQQLTASSASFAGVALLDTFGRSLGIGSSGDLRTPSTSILTLGGSSALLAPSGHAAELFGQLRVSGYGDVYADSFLLGSRGVLTVRTGSSLTINAPTAVFHGQTRVEQGAALTASGTWSNIGPVSLSQGSSVTSDGAIRSEDAWTQSIDTRVVSLGTITNRGTWNISASEVSTPLFDNAATANVLGSSAIFGSFTNEAGAITTVRSGTLFVFGSFTNNGTLVGAVCAGCVGIEATTPPGLDVGGDLVLGAGATLFMPHGSAVVKVSGDYDCAVTSSERYDMASATLRLEGSGVEQMLEVMSKDVGRDAIGLDRGYPGQYPIGVLDIGPSPTVVRLVDIHDNDGLGQSICEAIYVSELRIGSGSRLINPACKVYYGTLVNNGTVDVPANLIPIGARCAADLNGDGLVEDLDFVIFAGAYDLLDCADPTMPAGCPSDFTGDELVEDADFVYFAAAYDQLLCP